MPYRKLTRDLFVGMLATRVSHIRMLKNERIDGTADDFMSDMDYYEMIEEVDSDLKQYPADAVAEARELEAKLNDAYGVFGEDGGFSSGRRDGGVN